MSLYVVVVLEMSDHAPAPSLRCHLTTVPVWPPRVITPVGDPRQIGVVPPVTAPPTEAGLTVIVVIAENTEGHDPLLISALKSYVPELVGV